MTTQMADAFGYDHMGNAPHLLAELDRITIDAGLTPRAGGEALCVCGCPYYLHPQVQGALWLRRACTGLVKL